MALKVAINGFGRIGRLTLRAMMERKVSGIDLVAINDLAPLEINAHLLKYDTNYGRFSGTVEIKGGNLVVNGDELSVLSEKDPAQLPWQKLGADVVIESTGVFRDPEKAAAHLEAGAKNVIVSAPFGGTPGPDNPTIVPGVNDEIFDPKQHKVISNASCTTNCLAPVAKVLHDSFTVEKGLMTTIHAFTNDQQVLDLVHKDPRRARAASLNIIPTSTGAAAAIGLVIPDLDGKLDGMAMRVPVGTGSVVDVTCSVAKNTSAEDVNAAFQKAADGRMKGILEVTEDPIVSSDIRSYPASSVVDSRETRVIGNDLVKVISWYDNEWGYSCRLADIVAMIAEKLG